MTETNPPPSLAERAVTRLRRLASGNGLEPAGIVLVEKQEDVFALPAVMEVSSLCETQNAAYPGGARGKGRKQTTSFAALSEAVAKHRQEFRDNPDWISATVSELKTHDFQGWGLENAKVTLPKLSAVYSATELCTNCGGRQMLTCTQCYANGTVTCTQCHGQGREPCYYCGGRGENPQAPGQRCTTCNGTRLAPCRFCQTRGHLPCPTCHGKRGTPCPACQASGKMTQEVTVTCGAETHFKLKAEGLPAGLRRGLDRVGIANLGKGHADITAEEPAKSDDETPRDGAPIPVLKYKAALPYAELRVDFCGKKAVISAFGKRGALMGVPPFLDKALKPWRDKLREAALGKAPLTEMREARAMEEILSMTVAGRGRVEEVRKIYPYGLSGDAITSILADMRLALNKTTLKTRAVISLFCVIACFAAFYMLFMTGWGVRIMLDANRQTSLALNAGALIFTLFASWAVVNFSTRFVLRRRFPQLSLALQQKIGKTGAFMLGSIVGAFALFVMIAPIKPLWLAMLIR